MDKHTPIELNEENVMNIYNECLFDDSVPDVDYSDILPTKIFSEASCGQDSPIIVFSKSKIEKYYTDIEYMYGQLLLSHTEADRIYPESGAVTYKNKTWTADNSKLMAFYYLGVASNMIPSFGFDPAAG